MKKWITRIIILIIIAAAIFFVVFKLKSNKEALKAETKIDSTNAPVSINTTKAVYRQLKDSVQFIGIAAPFEQSICLSQTSGIIESIAIDKGMRVYRNQVIARVQSTVQQANLQQATIAVQKAKVDVQRMQSLFADGNASKHDVEMAELQLKTTEAQRAQALQELNNTVIKATMNGEVSEKLVTLSSAVQAGTPIATLVNIDFLKIKFQIPQQSLSYFKIGNTWPVLFDIAPNEPLTGKVIFIQQQGDAAGNFSVELQVKNKTGNPLKAAMTASVQVFNAQTKNKLIIDGNAIVYDNNKTYVWKIINNTAVKTEVTIGSIVKDVVEIINGLTEGEEVATYGKQNLKNNSIVKIISSN